MRLYNSNGNYIQTSGISNWGIEVTPTFPNNLFLLDVTGNGKTNICTQDATKGYIYELVGNTFELVFESTYMSNNHHSYSGDFNGDGKTDFFILTNTHTGNYHYESYILYSTGKSLVKQVINPTP